MHWKHTVSLDWLQARQRYLTASAIGSLVSSAKRGKPNLKRKMTDVMAEKLEQLSLDDCVSFGAAARGHWMESYALDDYNAEWQDTALLWDDKLISNGVCSWSPDGLTISMQDTCAAAGLPFTAVDIPATSITEKVRGFEVKAFGAAKHYALMTEPIDKLDVQWQLAMAFYVLPTLESMTLIGYNPRWIGPGQLFKRTFVYSDLAEQITKVDEMAREWKDFSEAFSVSHVDRKLAHVTEGEVNDKASSVMYPD